MDSSTCIEQKGTIEEIEEHFARVHITSFSACANCHSKAGCGMAEVSDKEIVVNVADNNLFHKGDRVVVSMRRSMGWKAAILAYVVPFVLILTALLILTSLHFSELVSGLGGLLTLIPYFTVLFLIRDRLKTAFSFSIRKAY